MSKDGRAYAEYILETIQKLGRIQQRGELAKDEVLYDATLRNLQTLRKRLNSYRKPQSKVIRKYPGKRLADFAIFWFITTSARSMHKRF